MARREITQYFDDLDKTPLAEDELVVVRFSVDGTDYTLDVSAKNAAQFQQDMDKYIQNARTLIPVKPPRRRGGADANRSRTREIRVWAQNHGIEVASRGKIPQEIIEKFNNANS